jgi:hypothetical protein
VTHPPRLLLACALTGVAVCAAIVFASLMSPMLALSLVNELSIAGGNARIPLAVVGNVAAPALAGIGVAWIASPTLRAVYLGLADRTRHIAWCGSWYVLLVLLVMFIAFGWSSQGFGLVAQLFVWPAIALCAAIVTDIVLTRRHPAVHPRSAKA